MRHFSVQKVCKPKNTKEVISYGGGLQPRRNDRQARRDTLLLQLCRADDLCHAGLRARCKLRVR